MMIELTQALEQFNAARPSELLLAKVVGQSLDAWLAVVGDRG